MKNTTSGHLAALFTIIIWGTTFISTKILLTGFAPLEILFFRFVMGFCALLAISPKLLHTTDKKQELTFAAAGLTGICLYYLLENIALTFTQASNVGVITSTAPFFTALLAHFCLSSEERLHKQFIFGFLIVMLGISCISFNGAELHLNPLGDLLAVSAAIVWAFYSLLTKKIGSFGYPVILATRRTFFYGIIFMLPALGFLDFEWKLARFAVATYLFNIVFLGLGASALCFVTWNYAVKEIGAVKASVYIYMVPVITVITSVIVIGERLTLLAGIGTLLTMLGLFLSEYRPQKKIVK